MRFKQLHLEGPILAGLCAVLLVCLGKAVAILPLVKNSNHSTKQGKPTHLFRMMLARNLLRLQARQFSAASASSHWLGSVPMGPADPILGLTERFNKVRMLRQMLFFINDNASIWGGAVWMRILTKWLICVHAFLGPRPAKGVAWRWCVP